MVVLCKEQSATTNSDHGAVSIQSVAEFLFQPFTQILSIVFSITKYSNLESMISGLIGTIERGLNGVTILPYCQLF